MKNVLKNVIATVFVFLITGTSLLAGEWIEKTVVDKEFKIDKNARLVIDHEFGEVRCENWDKQAISVMAVVRVKTSDEIKAEKIIKDVIVDVKGTSGKVELSCELNQKYNKNNKTSVNIDFYVKMPKNINLELENNFGKAYVETVEGQALISSGYGHLEIVSLANEVNAIEIEFGKGEIGYIAGGEIEISYSGVSIDGAQVLSVESEYSDVSIEKAESLSVEVEGGKLRIGSTGSLEMESSFTHTEVDILGSSLICETEYGNLEVGKVLPSFSTIQIGNSYGAIDINISDEASYMLEAEAEYGHIAFPEDKAEINYRNQKSGDLELKAVVGNSKKAKAKVSLLSEYGSINLK